MKPLPSLLVAVITVGIVAACLPSPRPPDTPIPIPVSADSDANGSPGSGSAPAISLLDELENVPALAFRLVASHLEQPTSVTHAGDGSGRLFILERRGTIRVVDQARLLPEPFLDLTHVVNSDNNVEQGLLGLAFHPDFPVDPRFFVYYTDRADDTVLASYQVDPDTNQAKTNSAKTLLTVSQPFTNHNGGQLAFGPDGYLYVTVGEGGLSQDPGPGSWLGKILRLDVDGDEPYTVPEDNPFVDKPDYMPEIWAVGMRNPWRLSFDRATGDLYIADVGQNFYEEIDFEPAESPGGRDYGWPVMEGYHCYESETCDQSGLTLPIAEYDRRGGCSVTGGYVYRGAQFPTLTGLYLFADYCTGMFWALSPGFGPTEAVDSILNPSSFGEDEAGELYVTDFFLGDIYQVVVPDVETQTNWPGAWPLATEPKVSVNAEFEGDIRLVGYDVDQPLASPGHVVGVTLFWQGQQLPDKSSVFVQVRDSDNNTVAQADHPLFVSRDVLTADGLMLRDGATLAIPPDLAAGEYHVLAGLYDPISAERLGLINDQSGENAALVTTFALE